MQLATFLGGLGLLLYGMQLLSSALCRLAEHTGRPGGRLRGSGPAACAVWGAAVTAVVQSSGTVTLFAMSAADAGLLTVPQAVALCWGANLGTTATGQLLRLAGGAALAKNALLCPLACFCGAALTLMARGRAQAAGQAVLGFGLTFTGLAAIQTAVAPLLQSEAMAGLLARLDHPLFAFAAGAALAAGLQSSSAAVALAQAAAGSGLLRWGTAVPLVMGTDIGTCSTALLAALGFGGPGRSGAARRVAAGHLAFNAAGCAGGALCALALRGAAFWGQSATFGGVADFQTAFNAATLCVLLPVLAARSRRAAGGKKAAAPAQKAPKAAKAN